MKKTYEAPVLFAGNGTIYLTVSQAAAIGIGNPAKWEEWWAEAEDDCIYEDFDINDPSTWPSGFKPEDEDSWYILLGWDD